VKIRHAERKDLASIVAIYNAAIPGRTATADTQPIPIESREAWFLEHVPDRHPLWVADTDELVAAWLGLSSFHGRPAYARTAEVSLYVHPGQQGRGVGAALLAHAVEQAAGLGLDTLLAFIFAHNTPSLVLFSRHAFARWGLLPGVAVLDGARRDLIILGRATLALDHHTAVGALA
jgi:L-amino acid N-acyltransferase YncA